jgi:hypothetical protein
MCDGVEMQNNRVWIVCLVRANDAHALMARKALCDWNDLLQPFLIAGHGARQRMLAENGRDRRIDLDFVDIRNVRNRSFLIGYHGPSLSVRWSWCDLRSKPGRGSILQHGIDKQGEDKRHGAAQRRKLYSEARYLGRV